MDGYIAGFMSGILQTIIGQPLDTQKTAIQMGKKIGLRDMLKGAKYAMINNASQTSIMFGTNNLLEKNIGNSWFSGFITGIIGSPIVHISDRFKIARQLQITYNYNLFLAMKGYWITLLRESIGVSIYFGSYEYMKTINNSPLISGGISGTLSWLILHPIDTIKTRMQVTNDFYGSLAKGNLSKGIFFSCSRGFIVNAVGFYSYEKMLILYELYL